MKVTFLAGISIKILIAMYNQLDNFNSSNQVFGMNEQMTYLFLIFTSEVGL